MPEKMRAMLLAVLMPALLVLAMTAALMAARAVGWRDTKRKKGMACSTEEAPATSPSSLAAAAEHM